MNEKCIECIKLLERENIKNQKDYREWQRKNHPDKGGSLELSQTVNDCFDTVIRLQQCIEEPIEEEKINKTEKNYGVCLFFKNTINSLKSTIGKIKNPVDQIRVFRDNMVQFLGGCVGLNKKQTEEWVDWLIQQHKDSKENIYIWFLKVQKNSAEWLEQWKIAKEVEKESKKKSPVKTQSPVKKTIKKRKIPKGTKKVFMLCNMKTNSKQKLLKIGKKIDPTTFTKSMTKTDICIEIAKRKTEPKVLREYLKEIK